MQKKRRDSAVSSFILVSGQIFFLLVELINLFLLRVLYLLDFRNGCVAYSFVGCIYGNIFFADIDYYSLDYIP